MFIFHDILTPINVSGLVVTLAGIALYNVLKYRQFQQERGGGGGHGGHGGKTKGTQVGEEEGVYARVGGRDREEGGEGEEVYLADARARGAERVLGSVSRAYEVADIAIEYELTCAHVCGSQRNESAISLDDLGPSAAHHQLGDDSPGSSPRSSGERTIRHREGSVAGGGGGYGGGGLGEVGLGVGVGVGKEVSPPVSAATGDEWDLLGGDEEEEERVVAKGKKED